MLFLIQNTKQKEKLSDALFSLANIIAATLIFGQFISDKPFNAILFIIGGYCAITSYIVALSFIKKFN